MHIVDRWAWHKARSVTRQQLKEYIKTSLHAHKDTFSHFAVCIEQRDGQYRLILHLHHKLAPDSGPLVPTIREPGLWLGTTPEQVAPFPFLLAARSGFCAAWCRHIPNLYVDLGDAIC